MEGKFCRLQLADGRILRFAYSKLRVLFIALGVIFAVCICSIGYLYYQLSDYRSEAKEFAEYKTHKVEQRDKLQQLLNDNEKMLRDMAEITNLEKKLRRAIIRDVDSSKLGTASSALVTETTPVSSYTGSGGNAEMDAAGTMAVLQAQNENINAMLSNTKKSVGELLSEVEGRGGKLANFPDRWPADGGVISSGYGMRTNPVAGGYDWHPGIDIALDFGAPVYAAAAGTVEQAGWNGGYGRYVRLNHGNGYATAYGHMSGLAVAAGQHVRKGEIIGFIGSTGYSTGPHLHYEVLADGGNVDPFYVLKRK